MEKHCGDCGILWGSDDFVCTACGKIFEESVFLRWVTITTVIAGSFHFIVARLDIPGRGWLVETLMTESFLILLTYGAIKVGQKLRNPQRRVFDELTSVFSDRWGRLVLLFVIVVSIWLGFTLVSLILRAGQPFPPREGEPSWFTVFRAIRGFITMGFLPPVALFAVWRQGVRFFDPRVACTYVPSSHESAPSE